MEPHPDYQPLSGVSGYSHTPIENPDGLIVDLVGMLFDLVAMAKIGGMSKDQFFLGCTKAWEEVHAEARASGQVN